MWTRCIQEATLWSWWLRQCGLCAGHLRVCDHNAPGARHREGKTGKTRELLGGKGILIKYSRMPPLPPDAQKGFMFHVLTPTGQVIFKSRRWCFILVIRGHWLSFPSFKYVSQKT